MYEIGLVYGHEFLSDFFEGLAIPYSIEYCP